MQLIQPKLAKIVQKPPRTQSQALSPPSGKSAGFGAAGADGAFSRSLVEGAFCASCCVESVESDDILASDCSTFSDIDAIGENCWVLVCLESFVSCFQVNRRLRDHVATVRILIAAEDESKDSP